MKLKNLGDKLRKVRLNNFLSQREIGEILGVTRSQICRYEKNIDRITDDKLYKILSALLIENEYFLKEKR